MPRGVNSFLAKITRSVASPLAAAPYRTRWGPDSEIPGILDVNTFWIVTSRSKRSKAGKYEKPAYHSDEMIYDVLRNSKKLCKCAKGES
jgi:hypothetical protein